MRNGEQVKRRSRTKPESVVEPSSGNVFADLGLPRPALTLAKAKLVRHIGAAIVEKGLSQTRAAEVLGIDQPKVSALLRGHFDGFSLDRLLRFLNALGKDVEIVIRSAKRGGASARTQVVAG